MNSVDNQKVRLSDSTTSSDSGVLIEDAASLDKDGLNINISTNISGNTSDLDNSTNNNCNLSGSGSFRSRTSSISITKRQNDPNNNKNCDNFTNSRDYIESKNSPISIKSHNISIVSLDDDAESTIIDSDSDIEDLPIGAGYITRRLGQHTNDSKDGLIVINNSVDGGGGSGSGGEIVTASSSNATKPNIGSIAVQNSSDITFGNKTFYQGPVTIKQYVLDEKKWKPQDGGPTDNPGFDSTADNAYFCEGLNDTKSPEGSPRRKFNLDKRTATIVGVILLIFIVVGAITITTIQLLKNKGYNKPGDGDDTRKNIPINSTIENDLIGAGKILRMITRSEWIAQPPNEVLDDQKLPVNRVIITHTASDNCSTQAACTFHVRFIQTFHMESRQWDDIAYNFLVGGDGAAYEGRGWDKVGAHTKGFNTDSVGIAFIGTFTKYAPPKRQIQVAQLLIQQGIDLKKISPNYKLFGHRQLIASESPGDKLYEIIKTWPHWTDHID